MDSVSFVGNYGWWFEPISNVEYVIDERREVIRYKPQANRHMLSAYAKYTMRIGNNRQTPADMHNRKCVLKKDKNNKTNWLGEHRKIRKRWK